MAQFKMLATHLPTGNVQEYGPWEGDQDPMVAAAYVMFVKGFVCGFNTCQYGPENYNPEHQSFELVEIPDQSKGTNVIGQMTAFASASVTHADGSIG